MQKFKNNMVIFILAAICLSTVFIGMPSISNAEMDKYDPSAAMIADFIFVRPLGILATATGSVFFVGSAPFSALGGNIGAALDAMIVKPAKFTFVRPLGDFD